MSPEHSIPAPMPFLGLPPGEEFEALFADAFLGRHVVFLGDSTTFSLHSEITKYLYASPDEVRSQKMTVERLNMSFPEHRRLSVYQKMMKRPLPGSEPSRRERRRAKSIQGPRSAGSRYAANFSIAALHNASDSVTAHDLLHDNNACGQLPPDSPPSRCRPYQGVDEGTKEQKLIAIRVPKPGSRRDFALSVGKGQGALPAMYAVENLRNLELQQGGQRADVVVLTGGLHYLHLWPAIPFESSSAARNGWFQASSIIANYTAEVSATIHAVRQHVGPGGVVIWKTTNDVCENRYYSVWKSIQELYKKGLPPSGGYTSKAGSLDDYSYHWQPRMQSVRRKKKRQRAPAAPPRRSVTATLKKCDSYVRSLTQNASMQASNGSDFKLNCTNTLLGHGGVETLQGAPVLVADEHNDTLASFRVLDAYALTRQAGCKFTSDGDGRHYPGIDLYMLRMIAMESLQVVSRPVERKDYGHLVMEARAKKAKSLHATGHSPE